MKLGYAALPEEDYKKFLEVTSFMSSHYAKTKVCDYKDPSKCDLALEPHLTDILITSRDPEEMKFYWKQWYDSVGTPLREKFRIYLELGSKAAQADGFANQAESWLDEYDDATFEKQLDAIVKQIRPFYEQLHAYVRFKLREKYGDSVVSEKGPIPMHLLGNMWGQNWGEISELVTPYPGKESFDVTAEMVKQGYTPEMLFEKSDEFFQSLNMTKMPDLFWKNSILRKPEDGRDLICHASAWDFYSPDDVRIKQCTRVTMDQLFTAHHEMGHIQYYLQYKDQPIMFREGANPGFHEAVGDVLALSVSTPKHLAKMDLLKGKTFDEESKINHMMSVGLDKIAFLPFAYTLDKYRYALFRGEATPDDNCLFWRMRDEFGGVEPPLERSNGDFDAPAKYHVAADVEYARYFVSFIVQFQFHKAACEKAGEYVPGDAEKTLFDCDIYGSAEAGNALKSMLQLGSSKPWPEAMAVLTGGSTMDAGALLEYFKPLNDWLVKENEKNGVFVGWEKSKSELLVALQDLSILTTDFISFRVCRLRIGCLKNETLFLLSNKDELCFKFTNEKVPLLSSLCAGSPSASVINKNFFWYFLHCVWFFSFLSWDTF